MELCNNKKVKNSMPVVKTIKIEHLHYDKIKNIK